MKSKLISAVGVEAGQTASLPNYHSIKQSARALWMTAIFSLLLIPAALRAKGQAIEPEYIPLNAVQLDQLVAPIALDPDPLVAQILIGATFPDQVTDANRWLVTKLNLSQDQRAAAASNMSWDPSVKGLVVFPVVLDSMAKNNAWTTQLGDAYYNQPDDVMDAIQAMRLAAFQTHYLVATPQQNVEVVEDRIEILPSDPAVVYVQYYNPWQVWGTLFTAYPGYVVEAAPAGLVADEGVSFEPAVSTAVDAHFGFSFGGWAPGWDSGAVAYNNIVYNSNSRTVANHDHFGGHDGRAFEHGGRGVPAGFHPPAGGRFGDRGFGHQGYGNSRFGSGRLGSERIGQARYGSGSFGRTPASRPMPRRIANPGTNPGSHAVSSGRSPFGSRTPARGVSNPRSASTARSTQIAHAPSAGRNLSANRGYTPNRPAAPAASAPRASSYSRPAAASRPASAARSFASNGSSNQRPAQYPAQHPAQQMTRPSSANNSFAGNRPSNPQMSRPSAPANRSFGGAQAMNRPVSMPRSSGAGFPGGHMGGGSHIGGGGKR